MKYTASLLVLSAALLTACGGDDDTPNNGGSGGDGVKTGAFMNGTVSQLHYATATQNGITDAQGKFSYMDGETVTFSIGGIVLGQASGADSVSPFDFFGTTPSTDPSVVDFELRDAPNVTPFERGLNVIAFLMALDADTTLLNGIDLSGRDAQLANAGVSFNAKTSGFLQFDLERISARYPHVGSLITLDAVLAFTYPALGLDVSGDALARVDYSRGDAPPTQTVTITSDARGQVTRVSIGSDTSTTTQAVVWTYNDSGRETEAKRSYSPDENGVLQRSDISTTTFNAHGQAVTKIDTYVEANDPAETVQTVTYAYDAEGRLHSTTTTTATTTTVRTYSFDASTNTLTRLYETGATEVTLRYRNLETYDARGNVTAESTAYDDALDGNFVTSETSTHTYDANGNLIVTEERDFDGTALDSVSRVTNTYDDAGRVTSITDATERSEPFDGTPDSTRASVYTYENGRIKSIANTQETSVAPKVTTDDTTYGFDSAGRITSRVTQYYDGDEVNLRRLASYTYDANGRLGSIVEGDEGVPEPHKTTLHYAPGTNTITAFRGLYIYD